MKDNQRAGAAGYVRMLALLRDHACTAVEFKTLADLNVCNAYKIICTMHRVGLVRIAAWRPGGSGKLYPVFSYPGGEDAPTPPNAAPPLRSKMVAGVIALATVVRELQSPTTKTELMAESGFAHDTVKLLLDALKANGLVRITDWVARAKDGRGQRLPVYVLGSGRDKPKPKPKTRREINRHQWQRFKARRLMMVSAGAANAYSFNMARSAT